jgi:hypothetical protein
MNTKSPHEALSQQAINLFSVISTLSILGLGLGLWCFTFQNDIFIKILAENQTILKLPLSQKHPNIKESSVFISGDSLPKTPLLTTGI